MNDFQKMYCEVLAEYGWFSHRYIAQCVFGPDAVDSDIVCVKGHLIGKRILVRDARNGLTDPSKARSQELMNRVKPKRSGKRRAG
jgi:hypothetical protein